MTSGADGRGVAAVGRYGCHCAGLRPPLAARGWVWQKIFRCTHSGRTFHVPAPEFPWVPLWSFSRSSYPTGLRKQSPLAMRYRPRSVSAWPVWRPGSCLRYFAHEDNLRPMGLDAGSAAAIAMTMASAAVVAVRRSITGYRLWHLA